MRTYFEYTQRNIPYSAFGKAKLNGLYDLSFFLDYDEYKNPLINEVIDGENLIPGEMLKSNKRLLLVEHNMTEEEKTGFISFIPKEFNIKQVSPVDWIKENTTLQEIETGKFLLYKSDGVDLLEDKYLVIN